MEPRRRQIRPSVGRRSRRAPLVLPPRLRAVVLVAGLVAAGALITVGITGLSSNRSGPAPDGPASAIPGSPAPTTGGAPAKVLMPREIGNGFSLVESGPQGVEELISRLPADLAGKEAARLRNLGFVEGAITIAYKPPVAPGPLTDTAVTVQILGFASGEGALQQLRYDAQGGLAAGFDLSKPYEWRTDYLPGGSPASAPPGVLIRKDPPPVASGTAGEGGRANSAAYVTVAAVVRGTWEIVIEIRSPVPPSLGEIDRLVTVQESKLGL